MSGSAGKLSVSEEETACNGSNMIKGRRYRGSSLSEVREGIVCK